jgi:hypothetical protein
VKVPGLAVYVYWVPPWDVDCHMHDCPVTVTVHTRRHFLAVRPFSSYAQGGDVRGMTDFHGYVNARRWMLSDQSPAVWQALQRREKTDRRRCVTCLFDLHTCEMIDCRDPRPARWFVFPRHLWGCRRWRHRFVEMEEGE